AEVETLVESDRQMQPRLVATGGPIDKSAQVRVISGPFAGKTGLVADIDSRGGARVMLGLLTARLLLDQLEAVAEVKERPALQSSHRKNGIIGRSGK
ncbi:MAG: KOW motif-containing protein, partial [Polyangiaceae bacterium]|nr:KOW motif-containing protein [Polyangiaceae bacterium]